MSPIFASLDFVFNNATRIGRSVLREVPFMVTNWQIMVVGGLSAVAEFPIVVVGWSIAVVGGPIVVGEGPIVVEGGPITVIGGPICGCGILSFSSCFL